MITKENANEYFTGNRKYFSEAKSRIDKLWDLEQKIHKENCEQGLSSVQREKLLEIHQKVSGARKVLEGENNIRGLLDQNLLNKDLKAANETLKSLNKYRQETYPAYYHDNAKVADVCIKCLNDDFNKGFKSRKECIIENLKTSNFIVEDNPKADGAEPLIELSAFSEVKKHSSNIDKVAQETGVDARLIRSIMYMETTHGYYDAVPALFDKNKSILPMNINTDYWGDAFGTRADLKQSYNNIKAGAVMLSRIQSNMPSGSSIDKIATLYNNINAKKVSDYGARVKKIYEAQPWIESSQPNPVYGPASISP